jgi:3-isopropylmalate dehydrogenase
MMKDVYTIAVGKGDGIGPEVIESALKVVQSATDSQGLKGLLNFRNVDIGWTSYYMHGSPLTDETLNIVSSCDCMILGPLEVGEYPGANRSPSGIIRRKFDLYANVRPVKSYIPTNQKPIDVVIVRENTEGFYADRNMYQGSGEFMPTNDLALAVRVITRHKSAKISEAAMRIALNRRKIVTAVHKGNVLKMSDGLFREEFYTQAKKFPDITAGDRLIDSTAYDLIINPGMFDVIVTTNMYGDILSDEAAAIGGSLGIAPALNHGDGWAMAQAAHGTAPNIVGKGIANPISEIMSTGMLLNWLGNRYTDERLINAGKKINDSVEHTLKNAYDLTPDLGGNGDTKKVTDSIISAL